MATNLADALASADLSWQGNYTTGDKRWKPKQLHKHYRLIIYHRDEMIASLSTCELPGILSLAVAVTMSSQSILTNQVDP